MRRDRRQEFRETLHSLNQRYYQQWLRAERLERELARVRFRWWGPILSWALWLKRTLLPLKTHPLEASLPAGEILPEPQGNASGRVSVIIPFRDRMDLLRVCLRSLKRTSHRDDVEIVLVDNGSREPSSSRILNRLRRRPNVKIVEQPGPFNFSSLCNAGAGVATGEYLLFLNNDTEALTHDWREHFLRVANVAEVGIVGALLIYPDNTIQHAGLMPDDQGRWIHVGRGRPASECDAIRVVPGVTGACLFLRRSLFQELNGFDETLPLTYSDVDLCRKAKERNLKCVVTPQVRFIHYEGLTRGFSGDEVGAEHLESLKAFPAVGSV